MADSRLEKCVLETHLPAVSWSQKQLQNSDLRCSRAGDSGFFQLQLLPGLSLLTAEVWQMGQSELKAFKKQQAKSKIDYECTTFCKPVKSLGRAVLILIIEEKQVEAKNYAQISLVNLSPQLLLLQPPWPKPLSFMKQHFSLLFVLLPGSTYQ